MDAFLLQKELLSKIEDPIIFDVGACVGDVSLIYRNLFPNSMIYAFEPYNQAFDTLLIKTKEKNIKCLNLAVGDISGKGTLNLNAAFPANSLLASHEKGNENWDDGGMLTTIGTQEVIICTIDGFLKENNIGQVDILKMDSQGTEYDIIMGAMDSIQKGKIKLVYTEIITAPTYIGQKHLDEVLKLFRDCKFDLFDIFSLSYTAKNKKLRQIDALFIHDSFYGGL